MQQRRLGVIMFTDIVGYTALRGSDEDRAFEVLAKNQKIHSKIIYIPSGVFRRRPRTFKVEFIRKSWRIQT